MRHLLSAHRAKETVDLLKRETRDFIPPSLDLQIVRTSNPIDYEIWSVLQQRVYSRNIQTVDEL